MELLEFLKQHNYLVGGGVISVGTGTSRDYTPITLARMPCKDAPDEGPTIIYCFSDETQMEEALKLKKLLDENGIFYNEEPSSSNVAKTLRHSAAMLIELAEEFEGK